MKLLVTARPPCYGKEDPLDALAPSKCDKCPYLFGCWSRYCENEASY